MMYLLRQSPQSQKKHWQEANQKWQAFTKGLALHLEAKETILFLQFEQATGMTKGPTQVMRSEHDKSELYRGYGVCASCRG